MNEDVKRLEVYLEQFIKTPLDRVLVNSYINSYRLFHTIEKDIDYDDMKNNETIRMQQLQIERNNLIKLGKEIKELSFRKWLIRLITVRCSQTGENHNELPKPYFMGFSTYSENNNKKLTKNNYEYSENTWHWVLIML